MQFVTFEIIMIDKITNPLTTYRRIKMDNVPNESEQCLQKKKPKIHNKISIEW